MESTTPHPNTAGLKPHSTCAGSTPSFLQKVLHAASVSAEKDRIGIPVAIPSKEYASSKGEGLSSSSGEGGSVGLPCSVMRCGGFGDFVAALWVLSMEKMVPSIHAEMQNTEIMDSLQHTHKKLLMRKQDLLLRLKDVVHEAKRAQLKKDVQSLKNKLHSARRIQLQTKRLENSILVLEENMDAIITNEMQKDILVSLQQATATLKSQIGDIGGPDTVGEVMSELEEEILKQREITEALSTQPPSMNTMESMNSELGSESDNKTLHQQLTLELEQLLADTDEDENFQYAQSNMHNAELANKLHSLPASKHADRVYDDGMSNNNQRSVLKHRNMPSRAGSYSRVEEPSSNEENILVHA